MSWSQFLANLANQIAHHWVAVDSTAGVLFVAFVSCMPSNPPSRFADYWQWAREALQTAIPAARKHDAPPPPQPESKESSNETQTVSK